MIFLHTGKYQCFLQVNFNTLGIKVSYEVILSFLKGMIKHSQNTQSNKFAIYLQHLKQEVRNGVYFLHANKHQSFYKSALSFSVEVARQTHILKICGDSINKHLGLIFRVCLQHGIFPQNWKKANIVQIHKKTASNQ